MMSKSLTPSAKTSGAAVTLLLLLMAFVHVACGDDSLEVRDEGEMVVTAAGGDSDTALFINFPNTNAGFNNDSNPVIQVSNGGSAPFTLTRIEWVGDSTGYITLKTPLETDPDTGEYSPVDVEPENVKTFQFNLRLPSNQEDNPPLNCPDITQNFAEIPQGIDADRYCGHITFRTNAPRGPKTSTVFFQVNQSDGKLTINPNILNYSAPEINRKQTQTFTFTNEGTGEISIQSINKVEFTTGTSSQFRLEGFCASLPQPVPAGSPLTCELSFTPEQTEAVVGKLLVKYADPVEREAVITVRTTEGLTAQGAVEPTNLFFANGSAGNPEDLQVTVTNNSNGASLIITNMEITPAGAVDAYTILDADGNPLGQSINEIVPRQNSNVYTIRYEPTSSVSVNGKLEISTNATNIPGGKLEVNLSSGDPTPSAYVAPGSITFDAEPGESFEREVSIHNEGLAALNLTGFSLQGLEDTEWSVSPNPAGVTVGPDGRASFTLQYNRAADDLGLDQGLVIFESDNPEQLSVSVRNNIENNVFAPVAEMTQDPASPVSAGTEITLDGSGSSVMDSTISFYTWSLLDAPTGSSVELPETSTPTVAFTPDVPGSYRVQLVVTSEQGLEGAVVQEITVVE